jgi:hypothetical protein
MPREAANAIEAKKSREDFNASCSIPFPNPSEMDPRIASGPTTNRREALTKPSTKFSSFDLILFFRDFFNFLPILCY